MGRYQSLSHVGLFVSPWTVAHKAPLWNFPGKSTGVGCHFLLQGIFPNPGIKPRSPVLQADSLPAEPQGKPRNIGVGSLSLSGESSWPRNQTGVSSIAGGFFTNWAMREADHLTVRGNKWVEHVNFICYWPLWDLQIKSPCFWISGFSIYVRNHLHI